MTSTALGQEHLRTCVSGTKVGWQTGTRREGLPANAYAAEFLPYDDLLPKTAVYVTNGGYGGVQYALRYGVPIVAAGAQEDKPEVVARVAWSGVGKRIRSEAPSPATIRRAVRVVLDDQRYRYRGAACGIAERMAAARGVHHLAEIVDALIAEAR